MLIRHWLSGSLTPCVFRISAGIPCVRLPAVCGTLGSPHRDPHQGPDKGAHGVADSPAGGLPGAVHRDLGSSDEAADSSANESADESADEGADKGADATADKGAHQAAHAAAHPEANSAADATADAPADATADAAPRLQSRQANAKAHKEEGTLWLGRHTDFEFSTQLAGKAGLWLRRRMRSVLPGAVESHVRQKRQVVCADSASDVLPQATAKRQLPKACGGKCGKPQPKRLVRPKPTRRG